MSGKDEKPVKENGKNISESPTSAKTATDVKSLPEVAEHEQRIVPLVNSNSAAQSRPLENVILNFRVGIQLGDIIHHSKANTGDISDTSIVVVSASATVTRENNNANTGNSSTFVVPYSNPDSKLNIKSPSIPAVKSEEDKKVTFSKIKRCRPHAKSNHNKDSNSAKERVSKKLYQVEKILDKRTKDGQVEYLLRWTGYTEDKDSWVSPKYMECADLIESFERQRNRVNRDRKAKRKAIELLSQVHDSSSSTDSDSKYEVVTSSSKVSSKGRKRVKTVIAPIDQETKPSEKPVEKIEPDSSVPAISSSSEQDTSKVIAVISQDNRGGGQGSSSPSSMETHCSGTTLAAANACQDDNSRYEPDIFPSIDLSSVDRNAPPVLKPLEILLTQVDQSGQRWYLVLWGNYMYPFAWVGESFMKTNFIDMVVKFYELLLSRYCP